MTGIPPNMRVLVDARWLGQGGAGRATEYLLRGLKDLRPQGRWILWGREEVRQYAWPGAQVSVTGRSPRWIPSQFSVPFMPPHDVALYMHQVRPLRPGRSVTLFHDTIQLRYGSAGWKRLAKRISHRLVARLSSSVVTVSQYSRDTLERDLWLKGKRVSVVTYPVDSGFVARVRALRSRMPETDRVLYLGQFAEHKNLERLIAAFGRTAFANAGGELLLVGGTDEWQAHLRRVASLTAPSAKVTIQGPVPQERLEELYATSRLLVMPSLEEGFGLPAWEALSVGMPVCVSTAGSLPEVAAGRATLCDPQSIPDIGRALDEAAGRTWGGGIQGPSMTDFAQQFVNEIAALVSSEPVRGSEPALRS